MRIGYLHVGAVGHGVYRYGCMLAAESVKHPDHDVVETHVRLAGSALQDRALLARAIRELAAVDVVHFQYNKHLWGGGWRQLHNLWFFTQHCQLPLVVTLHDVYSNLLSFQLNALGRSLVESKAGARYTGRIPQGVDLLKTALKQLRPDALALHLLLARTQCVLISSDEEARRLGGERLDKVQVIPHFVEQRAVTETREEARSALGLEGRRVVTLLGFIHQRKGHEVAVRALPLLPGDITLVFAGGASARSQTFYEHLLSQAETAGVAGRLIVTGYLPEPELQRYLAATDLALCPFEAMAASGSLSTWLSVGCPILASELPQIGEYNRLEPGAISTFAPYSPAPLAKAICQILDAPSAETRLRIARLREQLSLPLIVEAHFATYADTLGRHGR